MQLYVQILNEMVMEMYCMHAKVGFELFMYKCVCEYITDDKSPIRLNNLLRELQLICMASYPCT